MPPSCRCIEGYSGDGVNGPCNIIPSKLKVNILNSILNNYRVNINWILPTTISLWFKILGYSEPEFVTIEAKENAGEVSYLEDIGPKFIHTYEIINLGHQTVHNAQVFKTTKINLKLHLNEY